MRVVNEDGAVCAAEEIGEIQCLVDPNAEPSHYIGAQAKRSPGGWITYGDMGYLDEDGWLFIADRRTDMILRGGANIFPAEVEAALDEHPSVGSSVVISVPCDDLGHRVHAIVQPRNKVSDLRSTICTRSWSSGLSPTSCQNPTSSPISRCAMMPGRCAARR